MGEKQGLFEFEIRKGGKQVGRTDVENGEFLGHLVGLIIDNLFMFIDDPKICLSVCV